MSHTAISGCVITRDSLMAVAMARVEANYLRGKYLRLFVAAPR
jgi:hypothetical protein